MGMVMVCSPARQVHTAARRNGPPAAGSSRGRELSLAMSRLLRPAGLGQHGVLRCQPAPSGMGGTRSSTLAQQRTMVLPRPDETAVSANLEIRGDFDRAQLVKRPSVLSGHGMRSFSPRRRTGSPRTCTVIVICEHRCCRSGRCPGQQSNGPAAAGSRGA